MKILEMHVVGFGRLVDKKYSMQDVTSILQDNGEGKSTLASFIECMFYGLEAKNSSLRAYKPWNADFFGGNITFSANDKTYRVERSFGKRKADDNFKIFLMPDKIPTLDFSEKIGEELFGIDRSGFKRTCLFTHEEYYGGEGSIQSRLNSLVADTNEFNSFDKITQSIEKEIKTYENAQHRGKLPDIRREIDELRVKIATLENSPSLYDQKIEEQEKLNQRVNQLRQELKVIDKQIENKLLELGSDGTQKALEILTQRENELKLELNKCNATLKGYDLTLSTLQRVSEEKKKLDLAEKQLLEINSTLSLNLVAEKPMPTDEDLSTAQSNINKLNSYNLEVKKAQKQSKKTKGLSFSLFILALCLFAISLITVKSYPIIATVMLILSGVNLALGITLFIKNPLKKLNAQLFELNGEIDQFLRAYGYGGYEPNSALKLMLSEILTAKEKQATLSSLKAEKARRLAEIEQFKSNIDGFFAKFELFGSIEENTYVLKSAIEKTEQIKLQLNHLTLEKLKYSTPRKINESNEVEKLKIQKQAIQDSVLQINKQLQDNSLLLARLAEQISSLDRFTSQRKYMLDEQKKLEKERYVLEQALQGLIEAKQNLTEGAYEPIKKSLQAYCKTLLPQYNGFTVDTDFNVKYEYGGVTRDFSSLSVGQKQLVSFALRLGLIDALFEKEKPFIIIDDAFSLLDKSNFELCRRLVEEIGKNLQVIYFTPHESRKI